MRPLRTALICAGLLIASGVTQPQLVALQSPSSATRASVTWLRAPSVASTSGISLGGATLDPATRTGQLEGERGQPLPLARKRVLVRLTPASAAIITFGRSG